MTGKHFYVSPFFDVSGTYELRFTLRPDLVATTVTLRRHGAVAFRRPSGAARSPRRPRPWPAGDPPAPDDPADLGPDPGARHLAVASWPARPRSPAPHPAGRGLTMTVSTFIRWPAAAATPRAPLRAGIARVVFDHAVRRVPVRVTYPGGRVPQQGRLHRPNWRSFAPRRSWPGWAATRRSGSARPTWPGTGRAGPGTTWPTC